MRRRGGDLRVAGVISHTPTEPPSARPQNSRAQLAHSVGLLAEEPTIIIGRTNPTSSLGSRYPPMSDPLIPPELLNPALWLSDPRQGSAHPLYVALAILFALLIVGSVVLYVLAPRLLRRHRLRIRLARRLMGWVASVAALGLFWTVCRFLGAPLFARPLWLWFTLIALAVVVGYAIYYWRRRYRREISAYEEMVRRRRWLPAPRKRATARRR